MIEIDERHYAALADAKSDDFAMTTVSDWYAIYEQVSGSPATMPFDAAMDVARATLARIDERSREMADGTVGHLIHCQLLSLQHGGSPDTVRRAADHFIDAMPSGDAATVLLHAELGL